MRFCLPSEPRRCLRAALSMKLVCRLVVFNACARASSSVTSKSASSSCMTWGQLDQRCVQKVLRERVSSFRGICSGGFWGFARRLRSKTRLNRGKGLFSLSAGGCPARHRSVKHQCLRFIQVFGCHFFSVFFPPQNTQNEILFPFSPRVPIPSIRLPIVFSGVISVKNISHRGI